jgi:RNA polymerase sigma-70 factor (ECF subfamily)
MTDWPALVREHGPRLWAVAYRLVTHEADAADCVQRAFLDAVELRGPVRSWPAVLVRLTTARALDCLRRRYRRADRSEPLDFDPAGGADPLDLAAGGELAAALRRALADIDPVQAELFCLVGLDGWSNADAAAHLGVTANYAGVLLHRARAALRLKLKAFDPNPGVRRE